jgi:hypothetical protein
LIVRNRSSLCFVSLLALLATSAACNTGDGAASAAPAAGAVQVRAALVTPTLGGSVLAVGDQQLELAVLENGSVLGQVYDAGGALVPVWRGGRSSRRASSPSPSTSRSTSMAGGAPPR